MYKSGGVAYVYLCYGIHHLFNVVTNLEEIPHAILIRALEPLDGIEIMLRRTGKNKPDETLTRGPGNISRAMGIFSQHNGVPLNGKEIFIADDGYRIAKKHITATRRIGVDYAAEDAQLPYRFTLKTSKYLSGKN